MFLKPLVRYLLKLDNINSTFWLNQLSWKGRVGDFYQNKVNPPWKLIRAMPAPEWSPLLVLTPAMKGQLEAEMGWSDELNSNCVCLKISYFCRCKRLNSIFVKTDSHSRSPKSTLVTKNPVLNLNHLQLKA